MNKEEILLEALNRYGNFTTVTQEFNENQLDVIYELIDMVDEQAKVNGVKTSAEQALHGVTNRTCVTCLYCQALSDRDRNYAHGMMLAYGQAVAMVRERMAKLSEFVRQQKDLPPEINDIVNDNFWDLI